jgi:hypothetical protein
MPRWFRRTVAPPLSPDLSFAVDPRVRITTSNDDGRVVMHTGTARVWVMNRTAAEMWQELSDGAPLGRAAESLATRYERPVEECWRDLAAFTTALVAAGLLRRAEDYR